MATTNFDTDPAGSTGPGTAPVPAAWPFLISFLMVPAVLAGAFWGGAWLAVPFIYGWVIISALDVLMGKSGENASPTTPDAALFWHRALTWAWLPVQAALVLTCLWVVGQDWHGTLGKVVLMMGCGVACGAIGITYAHELVHQRNRFERAVGEALLIMVGYGHFATEHVYGHHRTVATPADPATARKGESFYAFLPRVVFGGLISAWHLDRERLAKRGRPWWHHTNPFWRYGLGFAAMLVVAWSFAGWQGILLYAVMSAMAVYQLEAVNYVEHYGLTRRHLGDGRFERVAAHHSWNAAHIVSNYLLINLQRHSDHHIRPDRRFPLLENHSHESAPQLPWNYSIMVLLALVPPLWFRNMDKRVDRWRAKFYPDITDWQAYDTGTVGRRTA